MTKNQKLDVLGVLLTLSGILLLLALFSPNNSAIVNTIVSFISIIFGVGRFIVAACMILIGILIILRHFNENLPSGSLVDVKIISSNNNNLEGILL